MPTIASLLLAAITTAAELPALDELDRFPSLPAVQAQLGALVRIRYQLRQATASPDRDAALRFNARQLAAWEATRRS